MQCALSDCPNDISEARLAKRAEYCSKRCAKIARDRRYRSNGGVSRVDQLARVAQLFESNGIDLDAIGKLDKVRINEWQSITKNAGGEAEIHDLKGVSVICSPSWADGPGWPVVQPASPVSVRVPQAKPRKLDGGWKTALLLPDPQFGFRRDLYDETLDPFHDERALDVALQIAEIERPDLTIWLGDVLDLAPAGKYQQEAGFSLTVQPAIEAAYSWIAQFAALSDETRMLEGNHDVRLQNLIIDNAKAAFGLKRAAAAPEEWPVISVPNLLRLNELGVEYIGGYPAGATYINDNLAAIHGTKIGNNIRSSASVVVEDERVSVITGHVHRIETRHKTRNTRGAPKFTYAHTPGCLSRIDGSVPSVKGGIDAFNRPVRSWEDWQNGVAVVRYQEGDGKHKFDSVHIEEGWTIYQGRELSAR